MTKKELLEKALQLQSEAISALNEADNDVDRLAAYGLADALGDYVKYEISRGE